MSLQNASFLLRNLKVASNPILKTLNPAVLISTRDASSSSTLPTKSKKNGDKVFLVTGSTSGIGFGVSKRFAMLGGTVIINGIASSEEVNRVTNELKQAGAKKVVYEGADMSKPDQIKQMIERTVKDFGQIDVLVNNAGVQFVSPIDEFPDDKWNNIIQINLTACFHTIKHSLPAMKKQGYGRIINIASAHAHVASPFKSAYVAAKHGVLGLTKTVALEVAEQGITVNAVCPGYVKTAIVINQVATTAKVRGISEEEVIRDVMLGPQKTKKFVEVDEVAAAVEFLAADLACSITGTHILLDGGWSAH